MPLAAVNHIELYYETHGGGAPLVVLGGLGTDLSELGMLTGPLADRYRVIAVDNRGAGRSAKPPGPFSIEEMAEDVAELLAHLGVPRAHVLGVSLGGRIAMALALAHPDRVRRLVLVSTAPRAVGTRWRVRLGMRVATLPGLRGRYPQPRRALRAQFDASTRFDCTDRLGDIRAPTLIVHGRSDRVAPVALAEVMRAGIPDARLVLLDGGHHMLFARAARLVREVDAFLAVDRTPSP
jgi:pimeloyl-ACP methyl ester carboxylesterase